MNDSSLMISHDMSTLSYSIVDAFTPSPFKGNPAAVVIVDVSSLLHDATLQHIAAEFNLSDTAFVTPIDPSKGRFGLRWFTPQVEVAICGHATLASASVLFADDTLLPAGVEVIEFETLRSGVLRARITPDNRAELEFPIGDVTQVDDSLHTKVIDVLHRVFKDDSQPCVNFIGTGDGASYSNYMLVEVNADYDLENAPIDPDPFVELAPRHTIFIVTQRVDDQVENFRSRVFSPAGGIPEDPVTGSAHSMLGPYWEKQLQTEGKSTTEMVGRQVSARGGEVGISLDRQMNICRLRGCTRLVAKGELYLPFSD